MILLSVFYEPRSGWGNPTCRYLVKDAEFLLDASLSLSNVIIKGVKKYLKFKAMINSIFKSTKQPTNRPRFRRSCRTSLAKRRAQLFLSLETNGHAIHQLCLIGEVIGGLRFCKCKTISNQYLSSQSSTNYGSPVRTRYRANVTVSTLRLCRPRKPLNSVPFPPP